MENEFVFQVILFVGDLIGSGNFNKFEVMVDSEVFQCIEKKNLFFNWFFKIICIVRVIFFFIVNKLI